MKYVASGFSRKAVAVVNREGVPWLRSIEPVPVLVAMPPADHRQLRNREESQPPHHVAGDRESGHERRDDGEPAEQLEHGSHAETSLCFPEAGVHLMTRNAATISTLLFTLAASALSAQAPPRPRPPETYSMFLQAQYAGLKRNIIGSAEKMPAEHFSFKPSPDVRTYASNWATSSTRSTSSAMPSRAVRILARERTSRRSPRGPRWSRP